MSTQNEKPIIFKAEMVNAILDPHKTQTRRVMKPQPWVESGCLFWGKKGSVGWGKGNPSNMKPHPTWLEYCPYGKVGDLLWVRETWQDRGDNYVAYRACGKVFAPPYQSHGVKLRYVGDWSPSIFMPRWASRIMLRITDVRIVRVQDISESDAKAEGIKDSTGPPPYGRCRCLSCRQGFEILWDSINAKPKPMYERIDGRKVITHYVSYPWDDVNETKTHRGKPWHIIGNPWLWALTFEVMK